MKLTARAAASVLAVAAVLAAAAPAPAAGVDPVIATVDVPGSPFATVSTHDGSVLFVSVSGFRGGVAVFRVVPKGLEQIGFVDLHAHDALGMALLADDSLLLVADGDGVALIDAAAARQGLHTDPVYVDDGPGAGTIEVTVTPDGHTAFASDERHAQVSVLRIERQPNGSPGAVRTGSILVDVAPVGFALSPDGATLYVVSEVSRRGGETQPAGNELSRSCGRVANGTLTAIDVARGTVVARLGAGCSPVRVVAAADGSTVWVSARGDDRVLAFDAAKILADPSHALIAQVDAGSAPVGIALLAHDSLLAVANSNRFNTTSQTSTATVLALKPAPSQRTSFATGSFPREFSVSPDGTRLYLTNYRSHTVEVIDVGRL